MDLVTGAPVETGRLGLDAGAIDMSPHGRLVAVAGEGALLVLDLETAEPVREPVGPRHCGRCDLLA